VSVSGEDVDGHAFVLESEQREEQADLEAVAGGGVVVEAHLPSTRPSPRT
jgi:hypothetical protein